MVDIDLKDGMIVQLRNGEYGIVLGKKILLEDDYIENNGKALNNGSIFKALDNPDDDIVKVFISQYYSLEDLNVNNNKKLIWQREGVIDWNLVKKGTKVKAWYKYKDKAYECNFIAYVEGIENPYVVEADGIVQSFSNCELI